MATDTENSLPGLLADEAYAAICLRTLRDQLDEVASRRDQLMQTRPPFGFFIKQDTKRQFGKTEQELDESESALRVALGKATNIHDSIERSLRSAIEAYLDTASVDFARRNQVLAQIAVAESDAALYIERLKAIARDLRSARKAAHSAPPGFERGSDFRTAIASVAFYGKMVDRLAGDLRRHAGRIQTAGGPLYAETTTSGDVPIDHIETWTRDLDYLDRPSLLRHLNDKEAAVRAVVHDDGAAFMAQFKAARASVHHAASEYLDSYWQQLRDHALQHYVTQPCPPDILSELASRYLAPIPEPTCEGIPTPPNPYFCER